MNSSQPSPRVVVYGRGYDDYSLELGILGPLGVRPHRNRARRHGPGCPSPTSRRCWYARRRSSGELIERLTGCRAHRALRHRGGQHRPRGCARAPHLRRQHARLRRRRGQRTCSGALPCGRYVGSSSATGPSAPAPGVDRPASAFPAWPARRWASWASGASARPFTARRAASDSTRTLVFDPFRTQLPDGVEAADLDTVFREADLVSLHAPLSPRHAIWSTRAGWRSCDPRRSWSTRHAAASSTRPPSPRRPPPGRLLGAGLDVFEHEPPDPLDPASSDSTTSSSTDHTAWYSEASLAELHRRAADEVAARPRPGRTRAMGEPMDPLNRAAPSPRSPARGGARHPGGPQARRTGGRPLREAGFRTFEITLTIPGALDPDPRSRAGADACGRRRARCRGPPTRAVPRCRRPLRGLAGSAGGAAAPSAETRCRVPPRRAHAHRGPHRPPRRADAVKVFPAASWAAPPISVP